ncbi:unnamed protein product, partial [Closterium sp. Naga37s-1]
KGWRWRRGKGFKVERLKEKVRDWGRAPDVSSGGEGGARKAGCRNTLLPLEPPSLLTCLSTAFSC